ncbi:MAG: DUF6481 family protein [Rhizomicrobium sp.]
MGMFKEKSFADRVDAGAKARAEQLERARAIARANQETAAERMAERIKIAAEREARREAREAIKRAEQERIEAEKRAEAERIEAERLAAEEAKRREDEEYEAAKKWLAEEEKRKITKLLADQKAMRDAKYAARKQRRR